MRFLATTTIAASLLIIAAVTVTAVAPAAHHSVAAYAHKRVHESLSSIPHGWSVSGRAHPELLLQYRIAVKQNAAGVARLEKYLLDHSSNPKSKKYGQHLTRSEINVMTAPSKESVDAVVTWLLAHGVTAEAMQHTEASDFISFTAPIHVGERLFSSEYNVYAHGVTGHQVLRTEQYHLPLSVIDHVDFISPATRFPHAPSSKPATINSVSAEGKLHALSATHENAKQALPGAAGSVPYNGANANGTPQQAIEPLTCFELITPKCIKDIYNFATYVVGADGVNNLGITGYLGQYWNIENLIAAESLLSVPFVGAGILGAQPVSIGFDPSTDLTQAGAEADLDVQYTTQLAWPTPTTFFSTPGQQKYFNASTNAGAAAADANEPYSDWLATVLNTPNVPQTITTSYGDNEDTVGYNYAHRVCTEFMELGAQGVSVLFASGDGGVGGSGACAGNNKDIFVPTFPAGCPWITAVGATALTSNGSEIAVVDPAISSYHSGGGFSNYFPRPAYQDAAVAAYFALLDSNTTAIDTTDYQRRYNRSGRGIPDVAALGVNFAVFISLGPSVLLGATCPLIGPCPPENAGPILFRIDGTSASSPAFAAVVALLNDQRLKSGKSALGFLNPLLYAAPEYMTDVIGGSNPGCGTIGFPATQGWDAATGLGTPDFQRLSSYLMTLDNAPADVFSTPFPSDVFTNTYVNQPDEPVTQQPTVTTTDAATSVAVAPAAQTDASTPAPTASQAAIAVTQAKSAASTATAAFSVAAVMIASLIIVV